MSRVDAIATVLRAAYGSAAVDSVPGDAEFVALAVIGALDEQGRAEKNGRVADVFAKLRNPDERPAHFDQLSKISPPEAFTAADGEEPGTLPQGDASSAVDIPPVPAEEEPGNAYLGTISGVQVPLRAGAEAVDREAAAAAPADLPAASARTQRTNARRRTDDDVRALFADYDPATSSVYRHLGAKGIKRGSIHGLHQRAIELGLVAREAPTIPGPPPDTMGDPRTWDALADAGVIATPAPVTPAAPATPAVVADISTSYRCEHCGQGFRTQARCERHEQQECLDRPGASADDGASFHCASCPYKARHLHLIEGHVFGVHNRQLHASERQAVAS